MSLPLVRTVVATGGLMALGLGLYYRARAADQGRVRRDLEVVHAQLAAKELIMENQQQAATQQISALQAERDRPASGFSPSSPDAPRRPSRDHYLDAATGNPAFRKALLNYTDANFRLHYAHLAQALALSEEKLQQLADANLKRLSDLLDLQEAARLTGPDGASAASLSALDRKVDDAYNETVRSLIGSDGLQQLQAYERVFPARNLVDQLAAQVADGPAPLTATQQDALTQLLAAHSATYVQGGPVIASDIDWTAVEHAAASSFSPAQLAALTTIRASLELQREYQAATAAARTEAGPP